MKFKRSDKTDDKPEELLDKAYNLKLISTRFISANHYYIVESYSIINQMRDENVYSISNNFEYFSKLRTTIEP